VTPGGGAGMELVRRSDVHLIRTADHQLITNLQVFEARFALRAPSLCWHSRFITWSLLP